MIKKIENCCLSSYGSSIAEYEGIGNITLLNGSTINCTFTAGQLHDGQVLFICKQIKWDEGISRNDFNSVKFSGKTKDGQTIWFDQSLIMINNLHNSRSHFEFTYKLKELFIQYSNIDSFHSASFDITNFRFEGDNPERSCFKLGLMDCEQIIFEKNNEYEQIARRVLTLHQIGVTSKVVFDNLHSKSRDEYIKKINDLCLLLSIARGTKINWIYNELRNENGEILLKSHASTTNRSFTAVSSIIEESNTKATKEFLEGAWKVIQTNPILKKRITAIINEYIEAKQGYIESKGIKCAVVLEMLKNYTIAMYESEIAGKIVDKNVFSDLISHITQDIHQKIDDDKKASLLLQNIKGANRIPFSDIISILCEKIEYNVEKEDLSLAIKIRNSLIHNGYYYNRFASESEIKKYPQLNSDGSEYFFLVNFLDKLFLRLFDYHGPYVNNSNVHKLERIDKI
ncbi:MAG: hypothetical protein ACYDDV_10255 [Methanoregula sp.]